MVLVKRPVVDGRELLRVTVGAVLTVRTTAALKLGEQHGEQRDPVRRLGFPMREAATALPPLVLT
jgi:hypothetical protein